MAVPNYEDTEWYWSKMNWQYYFAPIYVRSDSMYMKILGHEDTPDNEMTVWTGSQLPKPKILSKRFETYYLDDSDLGCDEYTVCYLETDCGLAVGFALHWKEDKNNPKLARHIAFERAKIAIDKQCSSKVIRKKSYLGLRKYGIFALSNWIGE